ncbi:MAG: N-acetyltransferase [Phycisphaerales bacterium]|nr:N-acetyltransferase [Phycisphaerales bacterium]
MLIRDLEPRDVAAANALTNHFIANTTIHWGYTTASDDDFREYWLKGRKTHPWLIAEIDGRFAGYTKASPWRDRDAYRFTAETTVYVALDMNRRGIGRALMLALLDRLRDMNFHQAIAGIALPNDPSIALHESLGFEKVGIFPEVGRKFDQWWGVGFWQRKL